MKSQNEYSLTKGLEICENCEFPHCLLKSKPVGLFETCEHYKLRTGNHISM